MLADDLASNTPLPRLYPGINLIQGKIAAAQKFSLATDFALAADGLCDNIHELEKIAPYCRLPYPLCWFECAQADRKHWMEAPLHYPTFQGAPQRVGFLCEAINGDLAYWKTYLCWSLKDSSMGNALGGGKASRFNVSAICVIYNTKISTGDNADCIEFEHAPFKTGLPDDLEAVYFNTLGHSDWAGEIRYLFAVLGLLNARNVSETERVDYVRLNRSRAKRQQHPLSSHTLLKIRAAHKPSLLAHARGHERSGEIRAHFVRGHFKTRKHGAFWWGPHMRGQLSAGYVSKDYEIRS